MSDSFPLLALSFFLIVHNVFSWTVSEPLNQTMNDDGSISVTCVFEGPDDFTLEARLNMNKTYICEVEEKSAKRNCKWKSNGNKSFTFTWMEPKNIHKSEFFCEFSIIHPLPVRTRTGPTVKLFQGCMNSMPPLRDCSYVDECPKPTNPPPEDTFMLLICVSIAAVTFFLYSVIITAVYLRLRISMVQSTDTLTYVPMQRNIKRRDPDTEYMDMREVQKTEGSHRDMNHNSHLAPSV